MRWERSLDTNPCLPANPHLCRSDLFDNEAFEDVADFKLRKALNGDTALKTSAHLAHIIL